MTIPDAAREAAEQLAKELVIVPTTGNIEHVIEVIHRAIAAAQAENALRWTSEEEHRKKYILRGIYEIAAKQRSEALEALREIQFATDLPAAVTKAMAAFVHITQNIDITETHSGPLPAPVEEKTT